MDEPSKNDRGNVLCHVTYGDRKGIVSAKTENLLHAISDKFGIKNTDFCLQVFDTDWNEWVDVLPENVKYKSKLKVINTEAPHCRVGTSPSRSPLIKVPVENTSDQLADEAEGAKLPGSPLSSSKKTLTFSNVSHPLLTKLRSGKQLDKKETAELVKKVFHVITEYTFFPTGAELVSYVKTLLDEFPALKEGNHRKTKKYWLLNLQGKFSNLRSEVLKREQKSKVDATTQTGLGNKPWQVWHPKYQKPPDNLSVFQDMSPIVLSIKKEFLKPEPDNEKIERLMCLTYQYRRGFIINMVPKITAIREIYPALFNCDEVRREFLRITGKESDKMFHSNLENCAQIIFALTKGCATTHLIELSVEAARKKEVPYDWKIATLLLLPHLFKENHNFLWFQNQRFKAEQNEPYIKCNAIMKVVAEGGGFFQVYAENTLVAETSDLTTAVECFLASFFIFLIEYRTDLKNTLQLLQSFFFEYDDPAEEELGPIVVEVAQTLKDRLKQRKPRLKS